MVAAKQNLSTLPVGHVKVRIGVFRVWPAFCFLEAYVGGEHVDSKMLPVEREDEIEQQRDIKCWKMDLDLPVGLDWPSLSLDLVVRRADYVVPRRRGLHLIRGGPHTSRFDAEIGRARVRLMDALVLGDDEEDEDGEDRSKRRHEEEKGQLPRMEGTLLFHKTVTLDDWVVPAPDRSPHLVSRGVVNVLMAMFAPQGPR
ncbi:hypothetical protein QOZ80_3BG0286490 [Eleusine coracana subsp. coracana]|nr:hypothetical protein QOZ80_3BG0286490 [Eleusine coracana subsp. coracana]